MGNGRPADDVGSDVSRCRNGLVKRILESITIIQPSELAASPGLREDEQSGASRLVHTGANRFLFVGELSANRRLFVGELSSQLLHASRISRDR